MGISDTPSDSGRRLVLTGAAAAVYAERAVSDAAALPPGAGADHPQGDATGLFNAAWGAAVGRAELNAFGRPLLRVDAESGPAAVAAAAGLALTGLRATGWIASAALSASHETLAALAGKRLPAVLHVAAQAGSRAGFSRLAGHDGVHALADAGAFLLFAADAQQAADLALIAHRLAELALTPGLLVQDAFAGTHRLESLVLPEPARLAAWLGHPDDLIEAPTPAQRMLYGARRRRIPQPWSVDDPAAAGVQQNESAYAQGAAGQELYLLAPLPGLADGVMEAYAALTGRRYGRVTAWYAEDADYLLVALGSAVGTAVALAGHLRKARRIKVGVVSPTLLRPFPADRLAALLQGRKGVAVLERAETPLAGEGPLLRELRAMLQRALENGAAPRGERPHPHLPVYGRTDQAPPLFAATWGLGGREPTVAELLPLVDNMLPKGAHRRRVFLSPAFQGQPASPKQEIFLQTLGDTFPGAAALNLPDPAPAADSVLAGAPPEGTYVLRVHHTAGREAFPPDETLAHTLADLKGWHVKGWSEPASPAPGQNARWHLLAGPAPLPGNAVPPAPDAVLVTEPARAFAMDDPLAGLKPGGELLLVGAPETPEGLWASLPPAARAAVAAHGCRVYAVPAEALARQEALDAAGQRRAQGLVLQGALLATPLLGALTRLRNKERTRALRNLLLDRAEEPDAPEVEATHRLLEAGADALRELNPPADAGIAVLAVPAPGGTLPEALKGWPVHPLPALDLHRFHEETALFHERGEGASLFSEPFAATGLLPAASGLLHDGAAAHAEYPHWLPERCTGCGACWSACPDAALPGLVNTPGELLQTALAEVERAGHSARHLPRAVRALEGRLRDALAAQGVGGPFGRALDAAIADTVAAGKLSEEDRQALSGEFQPLRALLGDFPLAVTEHFFAAPASGGLLSLTLDPARCKACGACVAACPEEALETAPRTPELLQAQVRRRRFWQSLPSTDPRFINLEPAAEGAPGPETLLLDKRAYSALVGGDPGAPGAGQRTVLHLFAATVETALQPRVAALLARLTEQIGRLETHIRLRLAIPVEDTEALQGAIKDLPAGDFTLGELSARMDRDRTPVDTAWLAHVTGLLSALKRLRTRYTAAPDRRVRAPLGMVGVTDGGEPWGPVWPYNPFPFPWARHLLADGPALALGVFEGHMAHMAEGFRAIRLAELELDGKYNSEVHDPFFARFGWRDFSEDEARLCPPVVLAGSERALGGAALADLAALLRSGRPLKVLCLDTGAPGAGGEQDTVPEALPVEGTGGGLGILAASAATLPPEIALLALAHRRAFVLQSSPAALGHLLRGFLDGLDAPRPALFHVYCGALPAHGAASHTALQQSRLALASRAHPLLRFDPGPGGTPHGSLHEGLSLAGNPAPDAPWSTHTLDYLDAQGARRTLETPLTFADFAAGHPAWQAHFRILPPEREDEALIPLDEYLTLAGEERAEHLPFVWTVDMRGRLLRLGLSPALVRASAERLALWRLLRGLIRADLVPVDEEAIAEGARQEVVETVWRNLMDWAQNDGAGLAEALGDAAEPAPRPTNGTGGEEPHA